MRRKLLVRLLMVGLAVACAFESSSALRGAESAMMTRDTQESATGPSDGVATTEAFPQRPVRLIEPFGAGGGPDITARALAKELSRLWHQPVNVENRPGSGATLAPALVSKAPADGYTLLVNTSAQAYFAGLGMRPGYDPLKDFIPVAPLTSQSYVFVTGRKTGFKTVHDLIAAAKERHAKITFGSTGEGVASHIGAAELSLAAGLNATHIPPLPDDAIADVIAHTVAGRTDYFLSPIPTALPAIRSGDLIALGVSTIKRAGLIPDVPTIAETGILGFDFPIWYGVWAPAGTPPDVVAKLSADITRALGSAELRGWMDDHGANPMAMTQPEFIRFVEREGERAKRLVRAGGTVAP
jgi:tripartite-type tricarboxylate transporter receptor subunit TctC